MGTNIRRRGRGGRLRLARRSRAALAAPGQWPYHQCGVRRALDSPRARRGGYCVLPCGLVPLFRFPNVPPERPGCPAAPEPSRRGPLRLVSAFRLAVRMAGSTALDPRARGCDPQSGDIASGGARGLGAKRRSERLALPSAGRLPSGAPPATLSKRRRPSCLITACSRQGRPRLADVRDMLGALAADATTSDRQLAEGTGGT